jgi:hypothetical protein
MLNESEASVASDILMARIGIIDSFSNCCNLTDPIIDSSLSFRMTKGKFSHVSYLKSQIYLLHLKHEHQR